MIKVITHSGTVYIIDEVNKQIKRVPQESPIESILRGFINIGEFQEYTSLEGLEVGSSLHVIYPSEQNWSYSTPIAEIDYGFEESNND